jgi:hypothetical protein
MRRCRADVRFFAVGNVCGHDSTPDVDSRRRNDVKRTFCGISESSVAESLGRLDLARAL